MGTNFYYCYKVTEEKHKTLQDYLEAREYKVLKEILEDYTKEYHIGKRSAGWQFLFEPTYDRTTCRRNSPWEENLESIKEFLKRDDIDIYDEYDNHYTSDSFWEEISPWLYRDENYMNIADYHKKYPEEPFGYHEINTEHTSKDGLRFSNYVDFC